MSTKLRTTVAIDNVLSLEAAADDVLLLEAAADVFWEATKSGGNNDSPDLLCLNEGLSEDASGYVPLASAVWVWLRLFGITNSSVGWEFPDYSVFRLVHSGISPIKATLLPSFRALVFLCSLPRALTCLISHDIIKKSIKPPSPSLTYPSLHKDG